MTTPSHRVFDPLLPADPGRRHAPPLRAVRRATACTRRRRPRREIGAGALPAPRRRHELRADRRALRPPGRARGARRAHELLPRVVRLRRRRRTSTASSRSCATRASSRRRARSTAGPVIEPAIVYANMLVAGQELAVHTDVPEFRGANRKLYPQWLMVVMHHSGLFDDYRMPIATAVGWFNDCHGGEFAYYPDGPGRRVRDAPGARQHRHHPRHRLRLPRRRPGRRRAAPSSVRACSSCGTTGAGRCATGTPCVARYALGARSASRSRGRRTASPTSASAARGASIRTTWRSTRILDRLVDDLRARGRLDGERPEPTALALLLIDEYIRFPAADPGTAAEGRVRA